MAPYLRLVHVDASHPLATDGGSGTADRPYRTISGAMGKLREGDDVIVAPGTYRETIVVPALTRSLGKTRIRAKVERTVFVKGSVEVAGWVSRGAGVYVVDWAGEEPEQVFRDGAGLQQIGGTVFGGYPTRPTELAQAHASEGGIWLGRIPGGVDQLTADSFTYDAASRRLFVKLARPLTAGQSLEVSTRRHVLQAENANDLTVQGLDFRHSNTSVAYRWGAVKVVGSGNVLDNLVIKDMDAACVQMAGADSTLSNSIIERCGQIGVSGFGNRMTYSGNQITYANTRGFNKWWEAGGMKLIGDAGLHDSVIRNNLVAYNDGDGIWLDWMNSGILIENNTTAYNAGFGIHYEASQTGTIRGNRAYGNSMRGIYLLESASTTITGNAVFGNAMEGIGVTDGGRSAQYPILRPVGNRIVGNSIAWNDFNRNWVQLMLPGIDYRTESNGNALKADVLLPRLSLGYVSATNSAFSTLSAWQLATRVDTDSSEQLIAMPAALRSALNARRLLTTGELPVYLTTSLGTR